MNDLTRRLREGDPAAADPGLSPVETAALRRFVADPAHRVSSLSAGWHRPLAVVTMVALPLAVGVIAARYVPGHHAITDGAPPFTTDGGEPRQLQFSTPGGTRIIWVFDPEFDLKETLP